MKEVKIKDKQLEQLVYALRRLSREYGSTVICPTRVIEGEDIEAREIEAQNKLLEYIKTIPKGESPTPNVYCNCEQVSRDYNKLKRAGNELVFACLRVLISYDGVHRLWKAIGKWSEVCANEGNRK